jgi:hypothetical protein
MADDFVEAQAHLGRHACMRGLTTLTRSDKNQNNHKNLGFKRCLIKKKVTKHIKLELGLHLIIYTYHRKHRPRKGNAKLA